MYNNTTLNYTEICGFPLSLEEKQELKRLEWWGGGVALCVIGVIGILGNTLSLTAITLLPSKQRSMFYKLLLTLAIFDIIFISAGGVFMVQQAFRFTFDWYEICFPKFIYPAAGFGMTGTKILFMCEILGSKNIYNNI